MQSVIRMITTKHPL